MAECVQCGESEDWFDCVYEAEDGTKTVCKECLRKISKAIIETTK